MYCWLLTCLLQGVPVSLPHMICAHYHQLSFIIGGVVLHTPAAMHVKMCRCSFMYSAVTTACMFRAVMYSDQRDV